MSEIPRWLENTTRATTALVLVATLQGCLRDDKYCPRTTISELDQHVNQARTFSGRVSEKVHSAGPFSEVKLVEGQQAVLVRVIGDPEVGSIMELCARISRDPDGRISGSDINFENRIYFPIPEP